MTFKEWAKFLPDKEVILVITEDNIREYLKKKLGNENCLTEQDLVDIVDIAVNMDYDIKDIEASIAEESLLQLSADKKGGLDGETV